MPTVPTTKNPSMARYIRGSFNLVCFTAFCQPCFCAPDCESCTLLVSTNPASTAASGLELTRETYFVAHRLEYVAVDVLLWRMWWCVLSAARIRCCFRLFPANAHGLRHASLLAKQSRHVETLIGRMRNARNTRSSSYPKRSCLLYTSPSPRDKRQSRMPSSA